MLNYPTMTNGYILFLTAIRLEEKKYNLSSELNLLPSPQTMSCISDITLILKISPSPSPPLLQKMETFPSW